MFCQKCGVENAANVAYCVNCGSPLPQTQDAKNGQDQPMPNINPAVNQPMPNGNPAVNQPMPNGNPAVNQPMPNGNPAVNQPMQNGNPAVNQPMPNGNPVPVQPMPSGDPSMMQYQQAANYNPVPMQYQQPMIAPVNVNVQAPEIPSEYKPLGMWAYFGYEILFGIPLIGLIFLIVFALGGCNNVNLKNFARSYFCGLLIFLVIFIVLIIILSISGTLTTALAMLNL